MRAKKQYACTSCRKLPLAKDEIGASKKLLGINTQGLYCIGCLAAYLEVTPEDIEDKIQMFKEDGCELFKQLYAIRSFLYTSKQGVDEKRYLRQI